MTTTHDTANTAGTGDIARSHTQEAAQDAKGRAAEVTGHASDAAHDVAGTAADQARNVKDETVRQARDLVSEARGQLSSQAGSQTQRITDNLHSLADELRQMADSGQGGTASELVHQASDRVHQVAGFLDGREPSEILDDVRSFARQRPGAFLAGAAVLGMIAGRVGRGVKDASSSSGSAGGSGDQRMTSPTPLTAPPGEVTAMDDYSTGAYGTGATTAGVGDGYSTLEGDTTSRVESDIDLTEPYTTTYAPEYGTEVQR